MKVETTRLGAIEIADQDVLEFENGLFGFEAVHRYVLLDPGDRSPLKLLQAVERPELAFAVVEPFLICPDYDVVLSERDAAAVNWWREPGILVFVILGIPADPDCMTANLKGPILVDPRERRGIQVVIPGNRYSARYPVLEALQAQGSSSPVEE